METEKHVQRIAEKIDETRFLNMGGEYKIGHYEYASLIIKEDLTLEESFLRIYQSEQFRNFEYEDINKSWQLIELAIMQTKRK